MRLAVIFVVLVLSMSWVHGHEVGDQTSVVPAATLDDVTQYLEHYRRSGNEAWLDAAESVLYADDGYVDARTSLLRAWFAQARHQFHEASRQLTPLLRSGHADLSVWLLSANLKRIVGATGAAREACLEAGHRQVVLGAICTAQVDLADDVAVDAERLDQLAHLDMPDNAVMRAWVLGNLADVHAAHGNPDRARHLARAATTLEPNIQNRAREAVLALVASDYAGVLASTGHSPKAPALALLRVMALDYGGYEASTEIEALHHAFQHDIRRGDYLHAREMAQFYLYVRPEPELAHMLAQENWRQQREPEDRQLLLAATIR